MLTPLRMTARDVSGDEPQRPAWWRRRMAVPAAVAFVVALVMVGTITARCRSVTTPGSGIAVACFGTSHVCLADDPRLPWLSYYRQHTVMLGDVLWKGNYQGRLGCVGFVHSVVCESSDPRTRGSVWQFEPVDLGVQLLPRGITPHPDAPLPLVVGAYLEGLRQEREDPAYWLGRPVSDPFCTRAAGGGEGTGECEVWFTNAQVRYPNRASATAADVYLGDLGRRVRP